MSCDLARNHWNALPTNGRTTEKKKRFDVKNASQHERETELAAEARRKPLGGRKEKPKRLPPPGVGCDGAEAHIGRTNTSRRCKLLALCSDSARTVVPLDFVKRHKYWIAFFVVIVYVLFTVSDRVRAVYFEDVNGGDAHHFRISDDSLTVTRSNEKDGEWRFVCASPSFNTGKLKLICKPNRNERARRVSRASLAFYRCSRGVIPR